MDSVFTRFNSYNFDADQRFLNGLQTLHGGSREGSQLLEAKLFFFNRFVESIDPVSYKQWSSSGFSHVTQTGCSVEPSACDDAESQRAGKSEESQEKQLSFAEVMQLIQEGKDVPGLTKPDIQASNQTETPSQMERILKPWEVASMSK